MPAPERAHERILDAAQIVVEYARAELADLDHAPLRKSRVDDALRLLGGPLPDEGDGSVEALKTLIEAADAAQVRSTGPRFFHWVMGGVTPAALAADWLTSLLDQNAGGYDASPFATELETVAIAWLLDLFDLPPAWGGVLVTGGTMANFTALAAARRWWALQHGIDPEREGLAALPAAPLLSSGFIHVTARKSLAMLGLGRESVQVCAADATGRVDLALMERRLEQLHGAPSIIVANAGEVNAGHFDPIADLAELASRHNAWLHVDGAFGLFAALSPRTKELLDGIEGAHSVSADGHKWLNVPFDCGFVFVREEDTLVQTFNVGADYLAEDDTHPNYAHRSAELSRRARAMTVWATLRAYGRNGYRQIVEQSLDNAAHLAEIIAGADDMALLAPQVLNIVCFRYHPIGVPADRLDELNLAIAERILTDGRVYVGTSRWAGKVVFRPAFVNWRTTTDDAALIVDVIRELGRDSKQRP